jgi:hypothetical protein
MATFWTDLQGFVSQNVCVAFAASPFLNVLEAFESDNMQSGIKWLHLDELLL